MQLLCNCTTSAVPEVKCKIWQAARATSAAPILFASITLKDKRYYDGAFKHNNPAAVSLSSHFLNTTGGWVIGTGSSDWYRELSTLHAPSQKVSMTQQLHFARALAGLQALMDFSSSRMVPQSCSTGTESPVKANRGSRTRARLFERYRLTFKLALVYTEKDAVRAVKIADEAKGLWMYNDWAQNQPYRLRCDAAFARCL